MFKPRNARQMGYALTVISELTVSVCIGGGAGYWLDSTLGTSPGFTLSLSLLALVVFFKRMIASQKKAQ
jgi:F0F1-type ATP synthase assembly protein I